MESVMLAHTRISPVPARISYLKSTKLFVAMHCTRHRSHHHHHGHPRHRGHHADHAAAAAAGYSAPTAFCTIKLIQ